MTLSTKANEKIKKFQKFSTQDVSAAIGELRKIKMESNRKHLQRLVYANLVDRFDILTDQLLMEFALQNKSFFHVKVLGKVTDIPISKKDFFSVMVSDNPKEIIEDQIKNIVRNEYLRLRHSVKLRLLLQDGFGVMKNDLNKSRVNANDGRIQTTFKRRSPTTPSTIIGYSDYLYSKRSGIVHGTGTLISQNDTNYLKKYFNASSTG